MRPILLLLGSMLAAGALAAQPQAIRFTDPTPAVLAAHEAQYLYLQKDVVSSIVLRTKLPIGKITAGANILGFDFIRAENRLDLWPLVVQGTTNIQIPIGDRIYTLIVIIGERDTTGAEPLVQAVRYFAVGGEAESQDLNRIGAAPVVDPPKIRILPFIQALEKAEEDRIYRGTLSDFREYPSGETYGWNDSFVTLNAVFAFVDSDMIILKVTFRNDTSEVVKFFGDQIHVRIRNQNIPVTLVYQRSAAREPECAIRPGEVDTAYLAIQGQKLNPRQAFTLVLPPDAAAIEAWARRANWGGR